MNFCLLRCDTSQEPNGNCSGKLVQMNSFILGGFFRVDFPPLNSVANRARRDTKGAGLLRRHCQMRMLRMTFWRWFWWSRNRAGENRTGEPVSPTTRVDTLVGTCFVGVSWRVLEGLKTLENHSAFCPPTILATSLGFCRNRPESSADKIRHRI